MKQNEFITANKIEEGLISSFAKGAGIPTTLTGTDPVSKKFIQDFVSTTRNQIRRIPNFSPEQLSTVLKASVDSRLRNSTFSTDAAAQANIKNAINTVQKNYTDPNKYLQALRQLGKQVYAIQQANAAPTTQTPQQRQAPAAGSLSGWQQPAAKSLANRQAPASTMPVSTDQIAQNRQTKLAANAAAAQANMNRTTAQPRQRATPQERAAAEAAARARRTVAAESKNKIVKKWGEE